MNLKNNINLQGILLIFFYLAISTVVVAFRDLYIDYPGPYCARRGSCCDHRQDNCSIPISTTLCYCDEFCDRTRGADCCPDFLSFCRNEPERIVRCHEGGRYYDHLETFKKNCNLCKCSMGKIECETDTCLTDDALIHNVNSISSSLGWTARRYDEFWGRKFREGLKLRLGTLEPTYKVKAMTTIHYKNHTRLPRHYSALDEYSGLLSDVRDQGWCGSSWVISTTTVASDRFAISSKGKEIVTLSPQHILSCARRQRGCSGGHLDAAWRYLNKQGVVDDDCFPYEQRVSRCKFHRIHSLSMAGCHPPLKVKRDHFYTMGPVYPLSLDEADIMIEIMDKGPVQATLRVYRDFFSYEGGIYRHSVASRSEEYGFHSVRLIGWGEERVGYDTVKYWIAANSWGTWWGESGYFRILRGVNECKIEDYILASIPHIYQPSNRM